MPHQKFINGGHGAGADVVVEHLRMGQVRVRSSSSDGPYLAKSPGNGRPLRRPAGARPQGPRVPLTEGSRLALEQGRELSVAGRAKWRGQNSAEPEMTRALARRPKDRP